MVSSILDDTKKVLGIASDYTVFDQDIILFINSVFADLHQMGVGPAAGYAIATSSDTWDEFLGDVMMLNNVQSYVFMRVKLLHDPPDTGYVVEAVQKEIDKAEWRITVAQEEYTDAHPPMAVQLPVLP